MMPGMVDYTDDPAVHIFADTGAAMALMRRTAEAAGCRVASVWPIGEKVAPPGLSAPGDAILVELEREATDEGLAALLDWLQREAEHGRWRGVVSAPVGLIDLVAASANHPWIEHLCEAGEAERLAAVSRAVAPAAPRVRDDGGTVRRVLQRAPDYAPETAGPDDLDFVRAVLRARRLRDEHFPSDLFADPAWDILLDLL